MKAIIVFENQKKKLQMFRLTIQWRRGSHDHVPINSLAGFSKTYTVRDDPQYVPVIIGRRIPGDGTYENTFVLCNIKH